MRKWSSEQMPDQKDQIAIVTGGNIGLGYQIAYELAKKGAHVVIACRKPEKGHEAIGRIEQELNRRISADVIQLDLTDLNSVHAFAEEFSKRHSKLDLLINNAGVVNLINRQETTNGLEMHMATNHYGHFALTGLLLSQLRRSKAARVVTMSSGGYRYGTIDFDDLNWTKRAYDRGKCYGDSKLANILFMLELERYFRNHSIPAISVSAHPGLSATERQQTIGIGGNLTKWLAQPVAIGALPALMAATEQHVKGGEYYGPRWFIRGYPKLEELKPHVFDKELAKRLWEVSENITGVKYP